MDYKLKSLLEKVRDFVYPKHEDENDLSKEACKSFHNFPMANFPCELLAGTKEDESSQFKSLLQFVEAAFLKPLSDEQAEHIVLIHHEDDKLNKVTCMSVLSTFAFAEGNKTVLKEVKIYITNHCDQYHPNVGSLMNNLGVMLIENALYEESGECFEIAKRCFHYHQDHLKEAVVTLNQALLEKALGNYKEAALLTVTAADLCHDISMRITNDAHLPVKLLRRVADMLREFGNNEKFKMILRIGVHFDIHGADDFATTVSSRQLMKIQLGEMVKQRQAEEVKELISHLFALLNRPGESNIEINAEFIRTVIGAAKVCRNYGQLQEACELLKKLKSTFLLVHGGKRFLYGSLLYQTGCFLHGCGRFDEAETALKQAEDILAFYYGENHHSVALCKSFLGSCILLKGNASGALEHLNEALTMLKKLNPNHPEAGEILLNLAFLHAGQGHFQLAQETIKEAEAILISSCDKVSCKIANMYFQEGMILQKCNKFHTEAVQKIKQGIDILLLKLGASADHPDVVYWTSFLGVLEHSMGMVEEAEKSFIDVQNCAPLDRCNKETEIISPEVTWLHFQDRDDESRDRCVVKAQVISLVNLVHLTRGEKRLQYLDKLVCCLNKEEIQEIQMRDFADQELYLFSHRIPFFDLHVPAFFITFNSFSDDSSESKVFLSSSGEKSYFVLFSSIQDRVLNMKEVNCWASSFRESVNMLFLQPKFRKGYLEGKDLYMEFPVLADPCDIFSFRGHLDCLPLLVELELMKSQEQCDVFDYLTSWESSLDFVKPVVHSSYFCFSCVNQRQAEFVFDHLTQHVGPNLILINDGSIISNVSPVENVATFIVQGSQNSFVTIVIENLSVIVKCCTVKESGSNCLCSSVRNATDIAMESLSETANVNFKSSVWLACERVGSVLGHEDSVDGKCCLSIDSDLFGSGLTLGTGNSTMPCTSLSGQSAEADLKREPFAGNLLNKKGDTIHPCDLRDKCRAYVDVGLCLLECLLNQSRPVSCGEKELKSSAPSSTDVSGPCGSYSQCKNSSLSSSFLSVGSTSSLNSLPASPSTFSLAGHNLFTSTKSPCEKEYKTDPSASIHYSCVNSEPCSNTSLTVSNCSGLSVKLPEKPSQSPDGSGLSQLSYDESLTASSDPGIKETKQLMPFTVNDSGAEELLICSIDQKSEAQDILSKEIDQSVENASKPLTTESEKQSPKPSISLEPDQSTLEQPLAAGSGKVDTGITTDDFLGPLLANLEDALAASLIARNALEQQVRETEEQLRQSEEEKRQLQTDLGRYLFLEEREKRRGRLLGGAASLQGPGLSLHSRLLEISNSLSTEEVKKMKFLAKSRVSNFRLARVTEAFELFEELETNGEFPCNYIEQLLSGIRRYDLVEILGVQLPSRRTKKGSDISVEQDLLDRASNSLEFVPAEDKFFDVQPDGHEREQQMDDAASFSSSESYFELAGNKQDDASLRREEILADHDHSQNSSILSSESTNEIDSDTNLSSRSAESKSSLLQNVVLAEESPTSDSSCNSSDLLTSSDNSAPATSYSTSEASSDSFSVSTSVSSHSSFMQTNLTSAKGDTQRVSQLAKAGEESEVGTSEEAGAFTASSEERVETSFDSCDGATAAVPCGIKTLTSTASTNTGSFVGSDGSFVITQKGANGDGVPSTQRDVFSGEERVTWTPASDATHWERLGARPKQDRQIRTEPVIYITDGLAGDFLARHTQDKALHDSIYQTDSKITLFNDDPSQGASYIDGDMSQSNRVQPYFGDCQVASATDPYGRSGNPLVSGPNGHLGGSYHAEHFSDNSGLWPNYSGDSSFSLYSNFLSRNSLTAENSDFVHSSGRFTADYHLDRQSYFSLAQQVPDPHTSSNYVLSNNLGMNRSRFDDPLWTEAAQTQSGDIYNVQRFTNTSNEQPGDSVHNVTNLTGDGDASALIADQNTDQGAPKPNLPLGNSNETTNIDGPAGPSAINQFGDTATVSSEVLAGASCHGTSILEPRLHDAENSTGLVLNNRDFGNDSVESSDNSLLALERRVAEACALVERVLREREEREQFGREIERKEQLIREQRARERREREERELREAESWPQQQEAINARSQWLCEHYQRHCRVRFPCCTKFYPCHRCHNISKACENEEAKACHATHLKCSHCQHEQEIGEDSAKCRKCGGKMSAYFCSICKHFTSVDKNPYHCEKCGICRIHQDKSFHCEVCNVCLDKRLEGKHKCRPDSGHDECCICLEDAFSGCQILPCSHKVHRECAIAMIQNGIRTCPICRHPLYSQPRE